MKYLILIENNSREHETWIFYFPKNDNNIRAFEIIKKIIPDNFKLGETSLTKEGIEGLSNTTSYLKTHNIFNGNLNIDTLSKITTYDDEFYKGQIENYLIDENIIKSLNGYTSSDIVKIELTTSHERKEKMIIPYDIKIDFNNGKYYFARTKLNVPTYYTRTQAKELLIASINGNAELNIIPENEFRDIVGFDIMRINDITLEQQQTNQGSEAFVKLNDLYYFYPVYWTDFRNENDQLIQEIYNIYNEPIIFHSKPTMIDIDNYLKDSDALISIWNTNSDIYND